MKNILITGANRGIGKGLAKYFLSNGENVYLGCRSIEYKENLENEMGALPGHFNFIECDLSDTNSIHQLSKYIENQTKLDLVINNAGVFGSSDNLIEMDDATLKQVMQVNFFAPLKITQLLFQHMNNPSTILNISSGMGMMSEMGTGYGAYRLSKVAMNGLSAVTAAEGKSKGIKCFTICPGWVQTDMGGPNATRSVEESIHGIMKLLNNPNAPSGLFYRDGEVLAW